MKRSRLPYIIALLFFLATGWMPVTSQSDSLSVESWEEAKKGLDYGDVLYEEEEIEEEIPPQETRTRESRDWNWTIPGLGPVGTAILFGLVILGLVLLLVRLVSNDGGRARVGENELKRSYTFEELEEHIHETELERYLRLAIEQQNFKAAIRVYYLMSIKALSEGNFIRWKKEKTNFDYVREMRRRPQYQNFRDITYTFEVVWYGDAEINSQVYRKISPDFESFLHQIGSQGA